MIGRTSQAEQGQKLHESAYEHNCTTAPVILSCSCLPKDLIVPDSPIAQGQKPEWISPHRRKDRLGARWTVKGQEDGSNGDFYPQRHRLAARTWRTLGR